MSSLPDEIWSKIFVDVFVSHPSSASVAGTCRLFRDLCGDEELWKAILIKQGLSDESLLACNGQFRKWACGGYDRSSDDWTQALLSLHEALKKDEAHAKTTDELLLSVVGPSASGKTSLVVDTLFPGRIKSLVYDPTIEESYRQALEIAPGMFQLISLFDTGGDEAFSSMLHTWVSLAHCVIIVFDVTSTRQWQDVEAIMHKIERGTSFSDDAYTHGHPKCIPVIIYGNKADLLGKGCWPPVCSLSGRFTSSEPGPLKPQSRALPLSEMVKFARSFGAEYIEGSAFSPGDAPALVKHATEMALYCLWRKRVYEARIRRRPPTGVRCANLLLMRSVP